MNINLDDILEHVKSKRIHGSESYFRKYYEVNEDNVEEKLLLLNQMVYLLLCNPSEGLETYYFEKNFFYEKNFFCYNEELNVFNYLIYRKSDSVGSITEGSFMIFRKN